MDGNLRHIGAGLLHTLGFYALRRRIDSRRGRRLLVLMYHDVRPDRNPHDILDDDSPTVSQFAAHIEVVHRRFRTLALADAVREMRNGGLREDTVAITFDDGYAAVHEHALPILRRHALPSTLFVLTGWIDGMQYWWHRLRAMVGAALLDDAPVEDLTRLLDVTLPGHNGDRNSRERFRAALARIAEDRLRDMPDEEREAVIASLAEILRAQTTGTLRSASPLTWEQIRELADHRVELAAHTHQHLNFRYASVGRAREDIVRSRDLIADRTGATVVGFAYPYGKDLDHYQPYADILRAEGFEYACTAAPGNNRNGAALYSLRRVSPPSTRSHPLIDRALCLAFLRDASFYDMRVR